jgi:hypothetical protein
VDEQWALTQLREFVNLTELYQPPSTGTFSSPTRNRGKKDDIVASAHVVEKILNRVVPRWSIAIPVDLNGKWKQHREAAQRAITEIERAAEIREKLGDSAPSVSASGFHPWAWEGARSLWFSGHYREAVRAAATKINAELQNKVGRRELADTKLIQECLSDADPTPDKPRLRLEGDDGGQTAKSFRQGVMQYGAGCFLAIRNPLSHDEGELTEQEGLEHLAALSLLARWLDGATVVKS